jgi:hypothetical protein
MFKIIKYVLGSALCVYLVGCSTTNSIPYKASTTNVVTLQNLLKPSNSKVSIGEFTVANGVDQEVNCRLLGPVKVAPGKSPAVFIKEAFQEELFLAQVYNSSSPVKINGVVEKLVFSSVSPANWEITMRVSSSKYPGYTASVKYNYETSFNAYSACKNVADAFSPAVQELLHQVIINPQFIQLIK